MRIILNRKISAAFKRPYGKFDTTIKGLVYEEEDNIHIIYTDRYTLPNMQDLKLVLSATRDDEQIPVMPLEKPYRNTLVACPAPREHDAKLFWMQ